MTVTVQQRSFTGGEWSPSLYARSDLAKYGTAVKQLKNVIPHRSGGASNRGGTRFIGLTKFAAKVARMIPFQFSVVQSYALEFGDQYIRVFKDGGRVVEGDITISGATQANPVVITATAHGYANGDWVVISSVGGMTELNGKTFIVANQTVNTFELQDTDGNNVDGTGFNAYVSGGVANRVFEIVSPYLDTDLALLKFTQDADTMFITHPSFAVRKLTRTSDINWTLTTIVFGTSLASPVVTGGGTGTDFDYVVTAVSASGDESLISNIITNKAGVSLSWSAITGADHYNVYNTSSGNSIFGLIGRALTTTFQEPVLGLLSNFSISPPLINTIFNATDGFPGSSAFFQQRLVLARTNDFPQTIFGSVIGAFENFNLSIPPLADDPYTFTLNAREMNEIRWIVPLNTLIIGTAGSEWSMSGGAPGEAITPSSVSLDIQSQWGVSDVYPVTVGNVVLFLERSNAVVRELAFSFESNGYIGNDLTILASHLFEGFALTEWAYQQQPDSIVWCVRDDGTLLGLTYYREHDIVGWHRHETKGSFESVMSLRRDTEDDEVYVIVKRELGGVVRRYVETLENRLKISSSFDFDVRDSYFVDSGLSLDVPVTISGATQANPVVITATAHGFSNGDLIDIDNVFGMVELNNTRFKAANVTANTFELTDQSDVGIDGTAFSEYESGGEVRKAVTSITGLDHLNGESVSVLADGNVIPGVIVVNGGITLKTPASRVHIGLGYTSDIETLGFTFDTDVGPVTDKIRTIPSVVLTLQDTRALLIGPSSDELLELIFRENEDFDNPTALFNGDIEKQLESESGEGRSGSLFIRNVDPLPMTVLNIMPRIDHGEN